MSDNEISSVIKCDEHCERCSRQVLWECIAEGLGVMEDPSEMTFELRSKEQGLMVGVGECSRDI